MTRKETYTKAYEEALRRIEKAKETEALELNLNGNLGTLLLPPRLRTHPLTPLETAPWNFRTWRTIFLRLVW